MAIVTITQVRRLREPAGAVRFRLDRPKPHEELETQPIELTGWVVAPSGAEKVEVWHNRSLLKTAPVSVARPDVARTLPDVPANCGFSMLVGIANLPADFELVLRVVARDGSKTRLVAITGRRGPLPSTFEPTLQPAIVTTLGRTGSTWLMRLLSRHPSVLTYDRHPYELRYAMYWLHAARVLTEPADPDSTSREDFNKDAKRLGPNPFFAPPLTNRRILRSWFGTTYTRNAIGFCLWNIEAYYREVAQRQGRDHALYFAEKFQPDALPDVAWAAYPRTRELILVRDFRDVAASILAFNTKRGKVGFGRRLVNTDAEYIEKLAGGARMMVQAWRSRRNVARLVRYEDLIAEPHSVLAGIFDYLGVDASREAVNDVIAAAESGYEELTTHRTSSDAGSSIGRWRRDLEPELLNACRAHLGPALEEFGYPAT